MNQVVLHLLLFLASILPFSVSGQNIVYNGDFELYDSLPSEVGEWMACTGWNNLFGSGTPDFAHLDGDGVAQMPHTFWCGVYPQNGRGAMTFKSYKDFTENFREYIGVALTEPMDVNKWYKVSFWLTTGAYYHRFGTGSDNIGLLLGTSFLHQPYLYVVDANPQFEIKQIFTDTTWVQFEFIYQPDSAYTCLMMGNFRSDDETSTDIFDPAAFNLDGAQYFTDNISITPIENVTWIDTVLCAGASYTLPDGSFAQGDITDTLLLTGADGQDSLVITTIQVHKPSEDTVFITLENNEDQTLPDGQVITHPGTWLVQLTDAYGCDSLVWYIASADAGENEIYIPNTFTPNGDGVNDFFIPLGATVADVQLDIYDRWGTCLYRAEGLIPHNSGAGWDGYYNGAIAQEGVYAYTALIRLENNMVRKASGNITLIR